MLPERQWERGSKRARSFSLPPTWAASANTRGQLPRRQETRSVRGRRRHGWARGGEVASALAVRILREELHKDRTLLQDFALRATGAAKVTIKELLNLLEYAAQRACGRIYEEAQKTRRVGAWHHALAVLVAGNRASWPTWATAACISCARAAAVRSPRTTRCSTISSSAASSRAIRWRRWFRRARSRARSGLWQRGGRYAVVRAIAGRPAAARDGWPARLFEERRGAWGHLCELDGSVAAQALIDLAWSGEGRTTSR